MRRPVASLFCVAVLMAACDRPSTTAFGPGLFLANVGAIAISGTATATVKKK